MGPQVDVVLSPHSAYLSGLQAKGADGPFPAVSGRMLIDTGADRTVITEAVAHALAIQPIGYVPMVGVSGKPEDSPIYMVNVTMGFDYDGQLIQGTFSTQAVGMPNGPHDRNYIGLLGRDFLQYMRFTYHGREGRFELDAPRPPTDPTTRPPVRSDKSKKELRARRKAERQARKKSRS